MLQFNILQPLSLIFKKINVLNETYMDSYPKSVWVAQFW